MKGSWRRYIREWLKGRTSESRGWPRTRWMPVSTRVRWKGCGRTDGPTKGCRRCIDALGAASPMGDHEPPIGVQAEWWQGRGDAGGGRACEAGLRCTTPRRGLDRRGARCASTGFQRSWKPRIAGSSSMCAGLSRVSRRCMRFLGFHFFLASVSFENSRIIASSSILDERLFQMGNL